MNSTRTNLETERNVQIPRHHNPAYIHKTIGSSLWRMIPAYLFLFFPLSHFEIDLLPDFFGWFLLLITTTDLSTITYKLRFPLYLALGGFIFSFCYLWIPFSFFYDPVSEWYFFIYKWLFFLFWFNAVFGWMGRANASLGDKNLSQFVSMLLYLQLAAFAILFIGSFDAESGIYKNTELNLLFSLGICVMIDWARCNFGNTLLSETNPEKLKAALKA